MRVGLWRWLVCVAVVVLAVAAGAPAQPPAADPKTPPTEKKEDSAAERARLQAKLQAILDRIEATAPPARPMPPAIKPKVEPKTEPTGGKGPDAIREAMNLFRDNDFETARMVFQGINPETLGKEDRAFVRYMLASCWRRLGRPATAEPIYREVANSGDDEFLASCAVWQLSLIGSERELQAQLEQLRSRAKSK